jgi:hypothetical protein
VRIGVLPTGDTAVRAAHSLAAHPGVESVVVIGPAQSTSFPVKASAKGCDLLIGSGDRAPGEAERHGLPLVWDGVANESGTAVWGASPEGMTLALMSETGDPDLVATAIPDGVPGAGQRIVFPSPVGPLDGIDVDYAGHGMKIARSENGFTACYVRSRERSVTIVDDSRFLAGVALAAGVAAFGAEPQPVWDGAIDYLRAAIDMGLVMGESG